MNPILLSTVLLILLPALVACKPAESDRKGPEPARANYYEYYADAVNYYYREPRNPGRAVAILREACESVPDRRDVSCYNLGVILESEKRPEEALDAYRRAWKLRENPAYREAIQNLEPEPDDYPTEYFQKVRHMVMACQKKEPGRALEELEELVKTAQGNSGGAQNPEALHRAIFEQPFFMDCLGHLPRYRELLAALPVPTDDLNATAVHHQAQADPAHTLWDMELHLLRLTRSRKSTHPVTAHWQGVLAAAQGGGNAASHLSAFYNELDAVVAQTGPDRKAEIETRALAMKRAAAVLIDRDGFFGGLRGQGGVRTLIAPYLTP